MRKLLKYAFMAMAVAGSLSAGAQNARPTVKAELSADSVAIGDQITLSVEVTKDIVQRIDFPTFENGMMSERIEVLHEQGPDTLSRDGRVVKLLKRYLLTTFDEGIYPLGRFPVLYADKNIIDTLYSADSLVFQVGTFAIDSTSALRDIKMPRKVPVKFGEFSLYLLWALLGLAAAVALVWVVWRKWRRKPVFGHAKPQDPPHVVAIRELEALHHQKVWQNNKHKLYYTRLTDIIREYIDGRYGVGAMEMTSDKILESLREYGLSQKSFEDLSRLLSTADLVKFAKHIPDVEENENAYTDAYYFVEETKPLDENPTATEGPAAEKHEDNAPEPDGQEQKGGENHE